MNMLRTADKCLAVRWKGRVRVSIMSSEEKVSQMILDVAAQFIEVGSSEEERQTHLDIACKAWNISILSKSKRNKEFNELTKNIKVDQKHQFYEDGSDEFKINPIEGELYVKDIAPNKLYKNKVSNWIESYFDDKYTDLEEKKKEAEVDFDKA